MDNKPHFYKCFNKGLINKYGYVYKLDTIYHVDKEIKFGNNGHGFHMCERLEDTLRYFNAMEIEPDICLVSGFGKYALYEDEYYGYYDMYAFEYMYIDKLLTRNEVITYALNLPDYRVVRFISLYLLKPEEIELFIQKFKNNSTVLAYIDYYQKKDENAFKHMLKRK